MYNLRQFREQYGVLQDTPVELIHLNKGLPYSGTSSRILIATMCSSVLITVSLALIAQRTATAAVLSSKNDDKRIVRNARHNTMPKVKTLCFTFYITIQILETSFSGWRLSDNYFAIGVTPLTWSTISTSHPPAESLYPHDGTARAGMRAFLDALCRAASGWRGTRNGPSWTASAPL